MLETHPNAPVRSLYSILTMYRINSPRFHSRNENKFIKSPLEFQHLTIIDLFQVLIHLKNLLNSVSKYSQTLRNLLWRYFKIDAMYFYERHSNHFRLLLLCALNSKCIFIHSNLSQKLSRGLCFHSKIHNCSLIAIVPSIRPPPESENNNTEMYGLHCTTNYVTIGLNWKALRGRASLDRSETQNACPLFWTQRNLSGAERSQFQPATAKNAPYVADDKWNPQILTISDSVKEMREIKFRSVAICKSTEPQTRITHHGGRQLTAGHGFTRSLSISFFRMYF